MLLLPYTPRAERTKAPDYLTSPVPDSYHVYCWWCHDNCLYEEGLPEATISIDASTDDEICSGEEEDYITHITFTDRAGFVTAWRVARMLNRGTGHVVLTREEVAALPGKITVQLGKRHKLFIAR